MQSLTSIPRPSYNDEAFKSSMLLTYLKKYFNKFNDEDFIKTTDLFNALNNEWYFRRDLHELYAELIREYDCSFGLCLELDEHNLNLFATEYLAKITKKWVEKNFNNKPFIVGDKVKIITSEAHYIDNKVDEPEVIKQGVIVKHPRTAIQKELDKEGKVTVKFYSKVLNESFLLEHNWEDLELVQE